jgi:bifunctional non-homologous end joining protein LigD
MTAARGSRSASQRRPGSLTSRSRRRGAVDVLPQIDEIEAQGGDGRIALDRGRSLDVSNLRKTFFPRTKHTKADLLRYYARIAPYLLPAIDDRPLVLKRFPNGIAGESFYQQRAPADPPRGVRVEAVADEGLTTQQRIIGGDLITLLYVVQLGAISIDPWHSRVGSVAFADYTIIDLDPGPRANFRRVIDVARWVKEELDAFGLHGILKTSGATGMHVVLPLESGTTNESARLVAEIVATQVAQRHPRETTVHRWVQSRPASAVYVDFLQNIRGKTVAGVYSARAEPSASVSTPLRWSELTDDLDPREFTIDTVPKRVKSVGDLWADGMRRRNSLRRLLGERPRV